MMSEFKLGRIIKDAGIFSVCGYFHLYYNDSLKPVDDELAHFAF